MRKVIDNKLKVMLLTVLVAMCGCGSHYTIRSGQAYFKHFTYEGCDSYFDSTLLTKGKMWNPILQGSHPGTSICRKGNDYYMASATFSMYPAIPIYHSTDLVNWELVNFALPTEHQYLNSSLRSNEGIYPPTIRYNKQRDMFYISGTFIGGGGHFIISAKDPAGTWSDPQYVFGLLGIHATLFFDDNGKTYLIHQGDPTYDPPYDGFKVIYIQEFDLDNVCTVGERHVILEGGHDLAHRPGWLESPHMYKHEGYYYLSASEGGSLGMWFASCIYRSESVFGPFERFEKNPNITQRYLKRSPNQISCVGHADYLELADGRWYVIFQGMREDESNRNFMCKETFLLPVKWTDDGWPTVLAHDEPIPHIIDMPFAGTSYSQEHRFIPHGNIVMDEHFYSDTLSRYWSFLRTPIGTAYYPNGDEGIVLPLEINNFRSVRHCGFLSLRVLNNKFSFGTVMDFKPETDHEFAGIAMFLGDRNTYQYGVTRVGERVVLRIQKSVLNQTLDKVVEADCDITDNFGGRICLNIDNYKNDYFTFKFRFNEDDEWQTLADTLSVNYMNVNFPNNHAFTGDFIGVYGSQEED